MFKSKISHIQECTEIATNLGQEIAQRYGPRNECPLSIVLEEALVTTVTEATKAAEAPEESQEDANSSSTTPQPRTIIAGLNGIENWQWLYIRHLWVKEEYRGQGLGLQLIQMAEAEARKRHCQGMYIDTFDTNTALFYEKRCGFQRCGEIVNFPPGNPARIYLMKDLR